MKLNKITGITSNPLDGMEEDADLARWVAPHVLVAITLRAAENVWGSGTLSQFTPTGFGALLTYCYARAIYESGEIECRLAADPGWHAISGPARLDASAIRQFRRRNFEKLQQSLAQVLEQVCSDGICLANRCDLTESHIEARSGSRLQTDFLRSAELRLLAAAQADSMAMDH